MTRLCKEILGPRDGPNERLFARNGNAPPDPSDEYVVGVLKPKDIKRSALAHFGRPTFISSQDINRMDVSEKTSDEDEDCDCVTAPAEITPELDPRALPKSIGLSFVVDGEGPLGISFCITWARYKKSSRCWERIPLSLVKKQVHLDEDATWKSDKDTGVVLYLRQRKVPNGIHVSLFFVNSTRPSSQYPQVEELIFQPQIRVVCNQNTKVVPIRGEEENQEDQDGLNLLFKTRYAKARGHLCGAIWDEVDPERQAKPKEPDEPGPPFSWVDGEVLEQEDRRLFTFPHVRNEFLPCYAVERASLTGSPEENLSAIPAEMLANLWDYEKLNEVLKPVLDSYERWIEIQKKAAIISPFEKAVFLKVIEFLYSPIDLISYKSTC